MNKFVGILLGVLVFVCGLNIYALSRTPSYPQLSFEQRVVITQTNLRLANPDVDDGCIITASYILLNHYAEVQHMMPIFGRCATEIVGLRVTKEDIAKESERPEL